MKTYIVEYKNEKDEDVQIEVIDRNLKPMKPKELSEHIVTMISMQTSFRKAKRTKDKKISFKYKLKEDK
jgi:hypothetical protein